MVATGELDVDAGLLLAAKSEADIRTILSAVPDARWRPLGGREINYPTVNVGSDPGDALVERVTDGIDALVERKAAVDGITGLCSPRQAAEVLFGLQSGRLLHVPERQRRALATQLTVTLRDSGESKHPTVVVEDRGIGQHPNDFENTLLSLNRANKFNRPELLGAFGQGGASVFAFTPYSIFFARRDPRLLTGEQEDLAGWTIVRFNPLDDSYKFGVYEYLVVPDDYGQLIVPRLQLADLPPEYRDFVGCRFTAIAYRMERYNDAVWQPKNSLWYLLNTVLFDPTYPILVRDERDKATQSDPQRAASGLVVAGNAVRLTEDKRNTTEYDNTHAIELGEDGTVVLRYWLVRDTGDSKKDYERMINYAAPEHAVSITLNGQRQGSMRRDTFNKLGLISAGKFLIVQVDCDGLSRHGKKELFSTTRDRLKDSELATRLEAEIKAAIGSDSQLRAIEQERKQRALTRQSESETKRINEWLRREIRTLREGSQPVFKRVVSSNAEYQLLGDQPLLDEVKLPPSSESQTTETELTPAPEVPTRLEVLNPVVRVPSGGAGVVRLSMDAPDDYISPEPGLGRGHLAAVFSKGSAYLRLTGYSALRRGVLRATVSADRAFSPGERGRVIFTVTRPDDTPLLAEADVVVVEVPRPRAKPAGVRPGPEEGPNVKGLTREEWTALGLEPDQVAVLEQQATDRAVTIYVLKEYEPLMQRLRAEAADEQQLVTYQSKFVAAMGLVAWLQEDQNAAESVPDREALKAELRRAAQLFLFSQYVAKESLSD